MEDILNTQSVQNIFKAFSLLKDEKEVKMFMRDLCTLGEIVSMAERLQVVQELKEGKSYRDICKQTGSSTATVTRVAHWFNHGTGGYKLLLERLHRP